MSLFQAQQQRASIESAIGSLLNDRLTRLRAEKAKLLTRYTSKYPEVVKNDKEIDQLQAVLDRVNKHTPEAGDAQDPVSPDDPALAGLIRQAEAAQAQVETLTNQQKKLKEDSEQYQGRLNLTPVREQQLAEILRDYDLFRQDYTGLLNKKLQSQLTTNLEENQEGQQFRLVDPPTQPVKPSGPKRLKICLGGMAAGILLGFALAFLTDIRDSSFHNEKILAQSFTLPVVMGIPLVLSPAEHRALSWRRGFEWIAGSAMALAMFAAEFYVFRHG
jgi:succinoglycan biosynthesis transport protein ExoP